MQEHHLLPIINISQDHIKILDYTKVEEYIKEGYFPYTDNKRQEFIAVNNLGILDRLPGLTTLSKIRLLKLPHFYSCFEQNFSHLNIVKSKFYLGLILKQPSAKDINYKKVILGFFIVFFCSLTGFINLFHLINNAGYFLQNCLKILLFKRVVSTRDKSLGQIDQAIILPIYTILIPLYQEINKLESIISSVVELNYPKHKLDVKIIVEADDYLLIKKLFIMKLPSYIHLLKVPYSLPRTKPKALNYAMQYSKGEYVVIYDAEDSPDSDQLLKALQAFQSLPDEYACVQAKLNFYNAEENLLTKFFSMEYSLWFEYLLKGLSLFNLPVTLGGTSNHFKVDILAKVGYWDAYNVTKDADLGIRLYCHGYNI